MTFPRRIAGKLGRAVRALFPRRRSRRSAAQNGRIAPSGISLLDLGNEAFAGLFPRPGRTALTVLGTVIGIAALVATLGLSRTAGNQIVGRFDELAATEILVSGRPGLTNVLPWDAPARLERLNGVVAAGNVSSVNIGETLVSTSRISDPQRQTEFQLSIQAASPGLFTAIRAELRSGRFPDEGHSQRAERVAVLGPAAANRLGIQGLEQLPAIAIGDDIYLVIGILRAVGRQPDLLASVIIPEGTAVQEYRLTAPETVVVETAIGATPLISRQIPQAVRPDDPRSVQVASPPEPRRVRDAVQSDLEILFLILGGVSLLVGTIGIANVTLVSVIERTGEIGLRRALGATRSHIAAQFLLESGAMGLGGGILGASLGTVVVVAVSAYQGWTPVLDPLIPFLAPLVGAGTGLISGLYPSLRAARMEPVEALRGGT